MKILGETRRAAEPGQHETWSSIQGRWSIFAPSEHGGGAGWSRV